MSEKTGPEIKHKTHTFKCAAKWTGGRTWVISAEEADDILGGPPVDFGGEPGRWTPEDLMLASVNSCQISTFVSLCRKNNFEFVSLESSIEGFLEHDGKGYRFTKMIVRPRMTVKSQADVATAIEYHRKAHEVCFMGNSVVAQITVEPEVAVAEM